MNFGKTKEGKQRFPRYVIYQEVGLGKGGPKAQWKKKILTVQKTGMRKTMTMTQRLRLNAVMVKKKKSGRRFDYIT